MLSFILSTIFIVILCLLAYTLYTHRSKKIFKLRGIRVIDTSTAVSKLDLFLGRKGRIEADNYAYKIMDAEQLSFCGITEMGNQIILIKDLDLIKKVLVKDFEYFVDRRQYTSTFPPTMQKMLPVLRGEEWKSIRATVSHTFTSSKIKRMMNHVNSVGKKWVQDLTKKAGKSSVKINVLDSVNQYTVDVISVAVFGMRSETIQNPNSPFAKMVARIAVLKKWSLFKFLISVEFPIIGKFFQLKFWDQEALDFFERILDTGLKTRMERMINLDEAKPNDFLQLLVEAQQDTRGDKRKWLTQQTMTAQALVFFFAGYRTTGSAIIFAMYALAVYQDVQEKLRKEVAKIAMKDGTWDYDALNSLVYMDMVICEVMRKFPIAARLEIQCVKDYHDKETGLFVPKGNFVAIPLNAIQQDSSYYENPDVFDPEHFSPEKKKQRNPFAFTPFGVGPRMCIAVRFALAETKATIANLVRNFEIQITGKTPVPMKMDLAGSTGMIPPKGLELKLTPIQNKL